MAAKGANTRLHPQAGPSPGLSRACMDSLHPTHRGRLLHGQSPLLGFHPLDGTKAVMAAMVQTWHQASFSLFIPAPPAPQAVGIIICCGARMTNKAQAINLSQVAESGSRSCFSLPDCPPACTMLLTPVSPESLPCLPLCTLGRAGSWQIHTVETGCAQNKPLRPPHPRVRADPPLPRSGGGRRGQHPSLLESGWVWGPMSPWELSLSPDLSLGLSGSGFQTEPTCDTFSTATPQGPLEASQSPERQRLGSGLPSALP